MTQRRSEAQLTRRFRERVAATGLTDAAAARAIGVSREYYRQVTHDETGPSMRFAIGAVHAGLADSIAEVAEGIRARGFDMPVAEDAPLPALAAEGVA